MRSIFAATLLLGGMAINAQTVLTIEGQSYSNSEDTWMGVNIPRTTRTTLTFRNNSFTSVNRYGYMLLAGDEVVAASNNNLDGAIISGNKFVWSGSDMTSITHGLFTGHNINTVIKHNYLDHVPMGIIRKSGNNMVNTAGGVAYNIIISPNVGIVVKGMSGVCIYNNTLYQGRNTSQTGRGLIDIYSNSDVSPQSVSHGTKIFNNIFYTKYETFCINIMDQESLTGLECDYNVYYCESGSPRFNAGGSVKTFSEWQAMGYDLHSVVIDPQFKDLNNFVPEKRLDYGTDLGSEWSGGLSINSKWGTISPETTQQNGRWQVGAVLYQAPVINSPPSVNISSPAKGNAFIAPATIIIEAVANDHDGTISKVEYFNGNNKLGERTSPPWSLTWKEVPEGTYTLTAAATDNGNIRSVSEPVTIVVEKSAPVINQIPSVNITSPIDDSTCEAHATLTFTANAHDSDGTVSKVEYFIDNVKIGESLTPPWSISYEFKEEGTFEITAAATDNCNAVTRSVPIKVSILSKKQYPEELNLYPNPNNGLFTIDNYSTPEQLENNNITVINHSGRTVYTATLGPSETSTEIDITSSPPGNYIIFITSGAKILTARQFVKN